MMPAAEHATPADIRRTESTPIQERASGDPATEVTPRRSPIELIFGLAASLNLSSENIDDVYSLANNSLLIGSLIFAFAVSMLSATLSREDMLAGDSAYARWRALRDDGQRTVNGTQVAGREEVALLSAALIEHGMDAVEWLLVSMATSIGVLVSLSISGVRIHIEKQTSYLGVWSTLFGIWIFGSYFCLFAGILSFFQLNHHMVDMIFPFYPATEMHGADMDRDALTATFYAHNMNFVDLTTSTLASGSLGVLQWQAGDRRIRMFALLYGVGGGIFLTHVLYVALRVMAMRRPEKQPSKTTHKLETDDLANKKGDALLRLLIHEQQATNRLLKEFQAKPTQFHGQL